MPQPSCYNHDLVIYAHGYVDAFQPIAIPESQLKLPDGSSIPQLITSLGFAFATTSYRRNGLAILEGIQDVRDLVEVFKKNYGTPAHVYLVGPSEGGLVTAKSIETYPGVYAGGVAACGPIGDFRGQINYIGDFRVLFDYYYPGLLPGNVTTVPQSVIDNWDAVYVPKIKAAVEADLSKATELLRVAKVATLGPGDVEDAVLSVVWYSAFATNDARLQLGGQPFDNIGRWYWGSSDDLRLNFRVQRFPADPKAVIALQQYETSGVLAVPLVTLHTIADPVIPFGHELLYTDKVNRTNSAKLRTNFPVLRFGHCQFNALEALWSLGTVVSNVEHPATASAP